MIKNLATTIINAGIYSSGKSFKKNFEVVYTYPEETADSTLVFTDVEIRWKQYGKFMLYFVLDGIESNLAGIFTVT